MTFKFRSNSQQIKHISLEWVMAWGDVAAQAVPGTSSSQLHPWGWDLLRTQRTKTNFSKQPISWNQPQEVLEKGGNYIMRYD